MGEVKADTAQFIVECSTDASERLIESLGKVKYRLPMINAYVVEAPKAHEKRLTALRGVTAVSRDTWVTAQMNSARKCVRAEKPQARGVSGRGVTIAILDTGAAPVDDLTKPRDRIAHFQDFVNSGASPYDDNGHGTHVAGIAAGNGFVSSGKYMGIAPESDVLPIKILDASGRGNAADVLAGLQWLMDNKARYNVRVANLSVGTSEASARDPLVRAVEKAWDSGVVVVTAAGNLGPGAGSVTSPGISRKVITVGASDDNRAVQIWGDTMRNFSGRGPTWDCVIKPDIVAPGADIVSCLAPELLSPESYKRVRGKVVSESYLRMSGTSMAAPIISGAVALLLQWRPELKPNEVKHMLKKSAVNMNYPPNQQGWGLLDIERLLALA
ncbi:MAG: S8 family peptidase [Clostridiales bacterium]|nr:S8 family peptidase [Clostridiales bacterium]